MATTLNTPNQASIVVKSQYQDRLVSIDLNTLLALGTTIASATVLSTAPVTTPALVPTVTTFALASRLFTVNLVGGIDGTSYGINVTVTDNFGATYQHTVAVLVQDDLAIKYQGTNPFAFQSLVDAIEVGQAAVGKAFFVMPAGTVANNGYVTWSLLDKSGIVYSVGNAYDYIVTNSSTFVSVESHAVVNVPSDTPPSLNTDKYQLRWEFHNLGQIQYAFENIRVDSPFTLGAGATDSVEFQGDMSYLNIVLDRQWDSVSVDVYDSVGNAQVGSSLPITESYRVSSGFYYQALFDTTPVQARLDPYIISWKYKNQIGPTNRDTGQVYVVNASIMRAVKSIESMVMKAKTTMLGFQDELFTVTGIVGMLSRGRDAFNGASGLITQFTMVNADSFIREYWIRYTEVACLEAQYLLEGEKAFNMTGQTISLDIDRTQYYQSLAQEIKTALDNDVKNLKANLIKKGLSGGDGSLLGLGAHGSTGSIGVSMSPVSTIGRGGFYSGGYGFNR